MMYEDYLKRWNSGSKERQYNKVLCNFKYAILNEQENANIKYYKEIAKLFNCNTKDLSSQEFEAKFENVCILESKDFNALCDYFKVS